MSRELGFSGIEHPLAATLGGLAILLALMCCLWLLRSEARLISRPAAITLLVLRLALFALLLAVFLQPVLQLSQTQTPESRIVVALDVSGSMDTADRHAPLRDLLPWARALGMVDASLVPDSTTDEPGDSADPGEESAGLTPAEQRYLDQARESLRAMSRRELVHRLLRQDATTGLESLKQEHNLDFLVFSADCRPQDEQSALALLEQAPGDTKADTDLTGLFREVARQSDSEQCRAIILLSDGRQTVSDADSTQRLAEAAGIPVYAIPVGSPDPPRDLIVRPVDAPGAVFPDDNISISTSIAAAGFEGQQLTVRLSESGRVLQEQRVTVHNEEAPVALELDSLPVGHHDLQIDTDVLTGEVSADNNRQPFSVLVADNRSRVLLVDSHPRWEFRYLHNLLERDERTELSVILTDQPFLKLLNAPAFATGFPDEDTFRTQLESTDLLILGDVQPSAGSDAVWTAVRDAVQDDGMTLVLLPGRTATTRLIRHPALSSLIPVTELSELSAQQIRPAAPGQVPQQFQIEPTAGARAVPMFDLGRDINQQARRIQSLPGHPWIMTGQPRPGAGIWAHAVLPGPTGELRRPLIVQQYAGAGQSVWMGMDSTWRWRRRAGDRWHHRFWGQLVRWAVKNKSATGSDTLRLSLSAEVTTEQRPVEVTLRWTKAPQDAPAGNLSVTATIDNNTNALDISPKQRTFALQQVAGQQDRWRTELTGLPAGRYQISLSGEGLPPELPRAPLTVVSRATPELADTTCDIAQLQQLTEVTGGQLLAPWQLSELPQLLSSTPAPRQTEQQLTTLWDRGPVLVLFLVLLMAQWTVRKLSGLP